MTADQLKQYLSASVPKTSASSTCEPASAVVTRLAAARAWRLAGCLALSAAFPGPSRRRMLRGSPVHRSRCAAAWCGKRPGARSRWWAASSRCTGSAPAPRARWTRWRRAPGDASVHCAPGQCGDVLRVRALGRDRLLLRSRAPGRRGARCGDHGFDTTSADVPMQVQGRHVVVSAPSATGARTVVDVYELENDTVLTRVAGAGNRPDLLGVDSRRCARRDGGAGRRQRRCRALLGMAGPTSSPRSRRDCGSWCSRTSSRRAPSRCTWRRRTVGLLEVLLEEEGAAVEGAAMRSEGRVSPGGRSFGRWTAHDVPAGASPLVSVPATAAGGGLPAVAAGGRRIGVAPRARRALAPAAAPVRRAADGGPDPAIALARAIVAVDVLIGQRASAGADVAGLRGYRAALKDRLVALLASRVRRPRFPEQSNVADGGHGNRCDAGAAPPL